MKQSALLSLKDSKIKFYDEFKIKDDYALDKDMQLYNVTVISIHASA